MSTGVAALGLLLAVACGEGTPGGLEAARAPAAGAEGARIEPDEAEARRQARLDRLRALGYAGFTSDLVEEGEPAVTLIERDRCAPGFTLVICGEVPTAELVDLDGRVVHAWRGADGDVWSNVELLDDGDVLVPILTGGRRRLERRSWDGELVWTARGQYHHDAALTPDGDVVTLDNEIRSIPTVSTEADVKDNNVCILSPEGELLDRRSIHDMLASAPELFQLQHVARMEYGKRDVIDLLHSNSVEVMDRPHLAARDPLYAVGNVLVSIRNQDTIAIFDWEQRALLWAWGQGELSGQHDATVLDDGHLLIFDNGLESRASRVVELDPVSREIVWQYSASEPGDFFTVTRGSSQRLSNGNVLVAHSDSGAAFEVTRDGEVVWCYEAPHADAEGRRATIVRVRRYPTATIEELLER